MNRRTQRVSNLVRNTLGELLLAKVSDPRIDTGRVSITRVEMPEDLLTAKVFVSVIGTDQQQRNALRALQHASGRLQDLMMRQISLRNTPALQFELDVQFKKTLETYKIISQAMEELQEKEQDRPDTQADPDDSRENPGA